MRARPPIVLAAVLCAGLLARRPMASQDGTSTGAKQSAVPTSRQGSVTAPKPGQAPPPSSPKAPAKKKSPEAAAKEAFDKALQAAEHMKRSTILLRAGKYAEAEKELITADKLQPNYCPALEQLSIVQRKQGKDDAALATLERAIRRSDAFDDKTYILAAHIFSERKAYVAGEKKLIEWAGDRHVSPNFHAAIGLLRMGSYELGSAELELRAALKMDPGNEAALAGMAQFYTRMNQLPKLQPFLDRGVEAKPRSIAILLLSANNLLLQEKYQEAKSGFEKILEIDPKNVSAEINMASAMHGLGDIDGAIRSFRKAIEMDGKNPQAPVNLAFALGRSGKPAEARDVLLAARKRGVDTTDLLNALVVAYRMTGEREAAIAAAKESLSKEHAQPEMKRILHDLESERGPAATPESLSTPATGPGGT